MTPLAAHVSTEDIIYEGYLIPKGSLLFGNIWFVLFDGDLDFRFHLHETSRFILSDPETYPDPEVFNPERFLGDDQQPDPREACFGWGRRVCSGVRLADSIIFTYVATALATLDVSRCVENGVELVPRYEFEEGVLRQVAEVALVWTC